MHAADLGAHPPSVRYAVTRTQIPFLIANVCPHSRPMGCCRTVKLDMMNCLLKLSLHYYSISWVSVSSFVLNVNVNGQTTKSTLKATLLHVSSRKVLAILLIFSGGAIAQAVNSPLPTAAARVRVRVRSRGICGGQSYTRAGFLWVLRFPLPILILPTVPHSSSIIWGWYNRPISCRR
jgi:hypothetical protein